MKSTAIGVMLICLLAVLTLGGVSGALRGTETSIQIDETTLYGDVSAADSIAFDQTFISSDYLQWDLHYAKQEARTVFTYRDTNFDDDAYHIDGIMIQGGYTNFSMSGSGGISMDMADDMVIKPAIELAKKIGAGEVYEETVWLKDYYDYYPLAVELDWRNGEDYRLVNSLVNGFFRIPIYPQHRVTYTITKDSEGNLVEIDASSVNESNTNISTSGVEMNNVYYFALTSIIQESGLVLPIETKTGQQGIYKLIVPKSENDAIFKKDNLEVVYAIDPSSEHIVNVSKSIDETYLLVTIQSKIGYRLVILDAETLAVLQEVALKALDGDATFDACRVYDGFAVLTANDGHFDVVPFIGEQAFKVAMSGDFMADDRIFNNFFNEVYMAYDGIALVAMCSQNAENTCSLYMAIYDKDGLNYLGSYENSLGRDSNWNYSIKARPVKGRVVFVK